MKYVDIVREYAASMPMGEAVDRAVDECIDEGILRDFLMSNKAETYYEEANTETILQLWDVQMHFCKLDF